MIRLFKRRTDKPSLMYPVFQRLGAVIDKRQRQLAKYLLTKTERLSRRIKFYWLAIFCILFGGASLYIFLCSIESENDQIFIDRMTFPKHIGKSDTSHYQKQIPVLTDNQYRKIQRFKNYMDSLQKSAMGKIKYDSIVKSRPGLMDSLLFV